MSFNSWSAINYHQTLSHFFNLSGPLVSINKIWIKYLHPLPSWLNKIVCVYEGFFKLKCYLKWACIENNCQLCKRWNLGIWTQLLEKCICKNHSGLWPLVWLTSAFSPSAPSSGHCPDLHPLALATDPGPMLDPEVGITPWEHLVWYSDTASSLRLHIYLLIWAGTSWLSSCLNFSPFAQPPTLGQ